jgi:hypothetical protein
MFSIYGTLIIVIRYQYVISSLEDWLLSLMSTLVMGFGPQD